MGRPLARTFLSIAGMLLTGCATSPWSSHGPADAKPAAAPAASTPVPATSAASGANSDAQAMQQVMAELQQVGAMDPAAQERLMADLKQTDPGMWPLVLQQFRAAAAYRRQSEKRDAGDLAKETGPPTPKIETPKEIELPKETVAAHAVSKIEPDSSRERRAAKQPSEPAIAATTVGPLGGLAAPEPASDTPPAKIQPPEAVRPMLTPKPSSTSTASPAAGQVVQASHETPAAPDWQKQLETTIRALEAQGNGGSKDKVDVSMQARLRMLYLLAGRREDAMQPIPSAPPAFQDFWSKEIYGLATWLDTERTPDASRRAAETKRILNEAIARLSESAPLVIRNLAFCTAVQSYGSLQPFKKNEFAPDQEVLLYAEVDNFVTESTPKGYHTSLKSSYQILDSQGQRVAEHEFAVIEETCQNARRDFFVGYHLRMPKRMSLGKHTLQLTVEDLKSHKVGQSTIDFIAKGESTVDLTVKVRE